MESAPQPVDFYKGIYYALRIIEDVDDRIRTSPMLHAEKLAATRTLHAVVAELNKLLEDSNAQPS